MQKIKLCQVELSAPTLLPIYIAYCHNQQVRFYLVEFSTKHFYQLTNGQAWEYSFDKSKCQLHPCYRSSHYKGKSLDLKNRFFNCNFSKLSKKGSFQPSKSNFQLQHCYWSTNGQRRESDLVKSETWSS